MTCWSEKDIEKSLANGECLICKKIKLAKEMGVAIYFAQTNYTKRGFICLECFERDVCRIDDIEKEKRFVCYACFICEKKFQDVQRDPTEIENTYTFEIIDDKIHNYFCIHIHKECYEANADDDWIFDGKRN